MARYNEKGRRIELKNIGDLIALDDFIIVEAHNAEDKSEGGIIIPDKAKQSSWRGTVIAVGPGKYGENGQRQPINVDIGDIVVYRNFLGWKMAEIDGKTYYAISGEERIAKIPKSRVEYID